MAVLPQILHENGVESTWWWLRFHRAFALNYRIFSPFGWDDVSFHGSPQIPTPNMDVLAADGIILNNYYVQPLCTPSRVAFLSGMLPIHTGQEHFVLSPAEVGGLPLRFRIMPQYFRDLGYETHMVGKKNKKNSFRSFSKQCLSSITSTLVVPSQIS
ncbi:hypothetical protein HPB47_016483 [Ixodes persulcatus]|uniref:Uncharacterized protein n=1 Tax=Ixodes persulcatus TaxID=34615 RepID=A0AC60QT85_IXOPE|nr:hypothetical protein HPB47_016483 [Ixodes persulcatus]